MVYYLYYFLIMYCEFSLPLIIKINCNLCWFYYYNSSSSLQVFLLVIGQFISPPVLSVL